MQRVQRQIESSMDEKCETSTIDEWGSKELKLTLRTPTRVDFPLP